jgi:hypothetical protein
VSIDYLPDEMNYERSARLWTHLETAPAFNAGWRAACEAWQARAQAKARPELCKECVVAAEALRSIAAEHTSDGFSCRMCGGASGRWPCSTHIEANEAALALTAAAKAHPQPAPDWRAACVVEQSNNGYWNVYSEDRAHWLSTDGPYDDQHVWNRDDYDPDLGVFDDEDRARAALSACATPPPDWRQP